ncbi:MAG TPA: hypothetical protein VN667_17130 [Burkholderiales bacterium]|nr:hypothetical protein [Burkholderiales bacterium]
MQCQHHPIPAALARFGAPLTGCELHAAVSADFHEESGFYNALQNHIRAGHIVPGYDPDQAQVTYSLVDWCAAPPPEQTELERVQNIVSHWGMEPH